MVKRKLADRMDWRRVTRRRFAVRRLETPDFSGYVTLLHIDEVLEPLYLEEGGLRLCIADRGYCWMQHFPTGVTYTVTTMFDARGEVVQWYIDICRGHGVDDQGVPWFDDLYLDVVVTPAGQVRILDGDDLDAALRAGAVSRDDVEFAWREARAVVAAIERDAFPLLDLTVRHRREFDGSPTDDRDEAPL